MVIGQACSNYLSRGQEISTLQSSIQSTGLTYCKSLKTANTCCATDVINGFADKAKALLARLTTSVSNRDKFIIQARKSAFALRGALARIQAATPKATENLQNYNPVSDSNSGASGSIDLDASVLLGIANGFGEIASSLSGNLTELVGGFDSFQEKRKECVEQLVNLQTAAWCLACDPTSSSQGLGSDTLTLNSALSEKLVTSCAPFIVLSAGQNAFIAIHFMSGLLNGMAGAMEKMAANDIQGGLNDFVMALFSMISSGAVSAPSSDDQKASTIPDGCTETSCSWITESLFKHGQINETLLAAGGVIEESDSTSGGMSFGRLLIGKRHYEDDEVVVKIAERKLQGGWNPDDDESGIEITFEANPAGIVNDQNSLSSLRNAVVGFSMAVLAVLFF